MDASERQIRLEDESPIKMKDHDARCVKAKGSREKDHDGT